jgi:hypothetical protein
LSADAESTQQTRRSGGGTRRRTRGATPARTRAHDAVGTHGLDFEATRRGVDPSISARTRGPLWETAPDTRGIIGATGGSDRDRILRRSLAVSDVLAAVLAVLFVLDSTVWGSGMSPRITDVLLVPFVILAAKAIGLYDRDQHVLRKTTLDEVPSLIYLSVLYALTVWLAEDLLFNGWLTRSSRWR